LITSRANVERPASSARARRPRGGRRQRRRTGTSIPRGTRRERCRAPASPKNRRVGDEGGEVDTGDGERQPRERQRERDGGREPNAGDSERTPRRDRAAWDRAVGLVDRVDLPVEVVVDGVAGGDRERGGDRGDRRRSERVAGAGDERAGSGEHRGGDAVTRACQFEDSACCLAHVVSVHRGVA